MGLDPHPYFAKRHRDERRLEPRVPLTLSAEIEHAGATIRGHVENLSGSGASFVTEALTPELEPGTRVVLRWTSPATGEPARHGAEILRCEDLYDGKRETLAYSVRFDAPIFSVEVPTTAPPQA